eukprot:scaffold17.g497.t1
MGVLTAIDAPVAEGAFNTVNLVTAFHRLAQLGSRAPPEEQCALRGHPATRRLVAALEQHSAELETRQVASVLFAHASLRLGSERLVARAMARLDEPHVQVTPQDAVLLAYAMARMQAPHAGFLGRFTGALLEGSAAGQPQACCSAPEAAAGAAASSLLVRAPRPLLLPRRPQKWDAASAAPPARPPSPMYGYNGKDLCLLAWSLHEVEALSPPLAAAVADAVLADGLAPLSMQSLCNLLLAVGGAGATHPRLADAVAAEVVRRPARGLNEQDLCNLAHGLATLWQLELEGAGASRESRLTWQRVMAPHMSVRGVAALSGAFALLGLRQHPDLMDQLAARAVELRGQWDAWGASSVVWAYSALSHDSPGLMTAMALEISRLLASPRGRAEFGPQAVSMAVLAYGSLNRAQGAPARAALAALAERAAEVLPKFTSQGLSNLAYGLATAALYPEPLLRAWRLEAAARAQEFSAVELTQLHLVEVALQLEAPHICADDAGQPREYDSFLQRLQQAGRLRGVALRGWNEVRRLRVLLASNQLRGPQTITSYQRQVFEAVRGLGGAGCQLEWRQPGGEYSIDIALPDQRIAIEADGPVHYASNSRHLLGSTALKRRLLARLGWAIVDVPFMEWQELRDAGARREYMASKLQAAGLALGAQAGCQEEQLPVQQGGAMGEAGEGMGAAGGGAAASGGEPSGVQLHGVPATGSSSGSSGSEGEGEEAPEQQQVQAQREEQQQEEAAAATERARRLAVLDFSRGRLSRGGLVAKEGSLRVAEQQRRERQAARRKR